MGKNRKFPDYDGNDREWTNGGRKVQVGGALTSASLTDDVKPAEVVSTEIGLLPADDPALAPPVKPAAPKKRVAKKATK